MRTGQDLYIGRTNDAHLNKAENVSAGAQEMATPEQLLALQATLQSKSGAGINVRGRAAGGRRASVQQMALPLPLPLSRPQLGNSRSASPVSVSASASISVSGASVKSTSSWRSQAQLMQEAAEEEEETRQRWSKPYRHPEGTYEGESNFNLQPHGTGTYYYKNGDVYAGSWKNGIRHGKGRITYTNGEMYTGSYCESLASGHGEYTFKNGDAYSGEFKMGMMHGHGSYKYHSGALYTGKFRKGSKCDKEGTFRYANGDRYVGRFHNNVPYGRGRLWVDKCFAPKDVWNGKLVEVDPRPSQMGAFTNFNIEDDVPVEYQDTSSQDGSSTGDSDSDADADSTLPSQQSLSGSSQTGSVGQPDSPHPAEESSVRSTRSRYTISSADDMFGHK